MEIGPVAGTSRLSRSRQVFLLIVLVCACPLLYLFWVEGMHFFKVPSGSMEPTLLPGDFIVTLTDPTYDRGEIVVIRDPIDRSDTLFDVKRIVGVGGDTVEIRWGAVMVNGAYASEPYMKEPIKYADMPPFLVPDGELFVLGDNRNHSEDSSVWPRKSVPLGNVIGKVVAIYLPYSRWQWVLHYPLVNAEGK